MRQPDGSFYRTQVTGKAYVQGRVKIDACKKDFIDFKTPANIL